MNRVTRRKLLVLAGAALAGSATTRVWAGSALASVRVPFGAQAPSPTAAIELQATAAELDPRLEQVSQWIGQLRGRGQTILLSPVGRVQREFRLGYKRTCALIDALAERGEWTIVFDDDGKRYARIHPKVVA
jgi:hypothetical protein